MDAAELALAGPVAQAKMVRDAEVSARELVELYLERIERLDPQLNAFRTVYAERALVEADQAQARRGAGDDRPLLGVPVAIKDNTDVVGDVTAHGTGAHGAAAREDADIVRRVRAAGGIVLGKTHVPELCMWPFTESATWGVTRNPWNPAHTPGGSSGGSAAAVAAGLAGVALASDGAGSIRYPAAFCGLFGLKPQRGRISLRPLTEHWHGLSVYGWVARRVADSALMYDVTADSGAGGAYTRAAGQEPRRLRVAVSYRVPPGVLAQVEEEPRRAVEETAERLRSLGHEVRERDPDYGLAFANTLVRYLRGIHDEGRTLPHPERLERRTQGMVRLGGTIPPGALARAREAERQLAARVGALWDEHDVLLTPMTTAPPPPVGRWEGRGALWTLNGVAKLCPFAAVWNATGQPAAAIPAGTGPDNLPRAVQAVARPDDEATLFALAGQLERDRPWADARPAVC